MIKIKIDDASTQDALVRLAEQSQNLKPAMQDIGEYLTYSTKKRFSESKAPDGTPWAANKESTLVSLLQSRGGLRGKKAAKVRANKKPLIGESEDLSRQFHYNAIGNSLEFGSTMEYSAVQQFGAKKGQFGRSKRNTPLPWGDIPARPFLGLSDDDKNKVVAIINGHLKSTISK